MLLALLLLWLKLIFVKIILIIILVTFTITLILKTFDTTVLADVGSFEDYGSSSDSWSSSSSSSSWGSSSSSSSWGSSSGDFWDSDYSILGSGIYIVGKIFPAIAFVLVIIVISKIVSKNNYRTKNRNNNFNYPIGENLSIQQMHQREVMQTQIENKIQVNDPDFNKEEFIAWSKNLFIKLQQAWTDRNWEIIRTFETESLFEQHKNQLQGYINNNQINVMDRICVNYAHLCAYSVQGDKEILTVRLNSRMADYIIDATTKEVIKGDKNIDRVNTYLLTFVRTNGVKTKPGTIDVNIVEVSLQRENIIGYFLVYKEKIN